MNRLFIKNNEMSFQGDIKIEKIDKKGFDNSIKLYVHGNKFLELCFSISERIDQRTFIELFIDKNSSLNLKNVCCGCSSSNHNVVFRIMITDNATLNWTKSYNWSFTDVKDVIRIRMFNESRLNLGFHGTLTNSRAKEDIKLNILGQNNYVKMFSKQILKNSRSKIIEKIKIKNNKNRIEAKAKVGLESSRSYIFMFSKAMGKWNKVSSICEEIFLTEDSIAKSIPLIQSYHGSNTIEHEARIGEIEKEKLYYLINRGIDPDMAKMLII